DDESSIFSSSSPAQDSSSAVLPEHLLRIASNAADTLKIHRDPKRAYLIPGKPFFETRNPWDYLEYLDLAINRSGYRLSIEDKVAMAEYFLSEVGLRNYLLYLKAFYRKRLVQTTLDTMAVHPFSLVWNDYKGLPWLERGKELSVATNGKRRDFVRERIKEVFAVALDGTHAFPEAEVIGHVYSRRIEKLFPQRETKKGYMAAIEFVNRDRKPGRLSHKFLLRTFSLIADLGYQSDHYREVDIFSNGWFFPPVGTGGGSMVVSNLMEEYVSWFNLREREVFEMSHPVERMAEAIIFAAEAFYHFVHIHPFIPDYNERNGRLLMESVLVHNGLSPLAFDAELEQEYLMLLRFMPIPRTYPGLPTEYFPAELALFLFKQQYLSPDLRQREWSNFRRAMTSSPVQIRMPLREQPLAEFADLLRSRLLETVRTDPVLKGRCDFDSITAVLEKAQVDGYTVAAFLEDLTALDIGVMPTFTPFEESVVAIILGEATHNQDLSFSRADVIFVAEDSLMAKMLHLEFGTYETIQDGPIVREIFFIARDSKNRVSFIHRLSLIRTLVHEIVHRKFRVPALIVQDKKGSQRIGSGELTLFCSLNEAVVEQLADMYSRQIYQRDFPFQQEVASYYSSSGALFIPGVDDQVRVSAELGAYLDEREFLARLLEKWPDDSADAICALMDQGDFSPLEAMLGPLWDRVIWIMQHIDFHCYICQQYYRYNIGFHILNALLRFPDNEAIWFAGQDLLSLIQEMGSDYLIDAQAAFIVFDRFMNGQVSRSALEDNWFMQRERLEAGEDDELLGVEREEDRLLTTIRVNNALCILMAQLLGRISSPVLQTPSKVISKASPEQNRRRLGVGASSPAKKKRRTRKPEISSQDRERLRAHLRNSPPLVLKTLVEGLSAKGLDAMISSFYKMDAELLREAAWLLLAFFPRSHYETGRIVLEMTQFIPTLWAEKLALLTTEEEIKKVIERMWSGRGFSTTNAHLYVFNRLKSIILDLRREGLTLESGVVSEALVASNCAYKQRPDGKFKGSDRYLQRLIEKGWVSQNSFERLGVIFTPSAAVEVSSPVTGEDRNVPSLLLRCVCLAIGIDILGLPVEVAFSEEENTPSEISLVNDSAIPLRAKSKFSFSEDELVPFPFAERGALPPMRAASLWNINYFMGNKGRIIFEAYMNSRFVPGNCYLVSLVVAEEMRLERIDAYVVEGIFKRSNGKLSDHVYVVCLGKANSGKKGLLIFDFTANQFFSLPVAPVGGSWLELLIYYPLEPGDGKEVQVFTPGAFRSRVNGLPYREFRTHMRAFQRIHYPQSSNPISDGASSPAQIEMKQLARQRQKFFDRMAAQVKDSPQKIVVVAPMPDESGLEALSSFSELVGDRISTVIIRRLDEPSAFDIAIRLIKKIRESDGKSIPILLKGQTSTDSVMRYLLEDEDVRRAGKITHQRICFAPRGVLVMTDGGINLLALLSGEERAQRHSLITRHGIEVARLLGVPRPHATSLGSTARDRLISLGDAYNTSTWVFPDIAAANIIYKAATDTAWRPLFLGAFRKEGAGSINFFLRRENGRQTFAIAVPEPHARIEEKRRLLLSLPETAGHFIETRPLRIFFVDFTEKTERFMEVGSIADAVALKREFAGHPALIVEGPGAMDIALSEAAAQKKGVSGRAAGVCDVILTPDYVSGRLLCGLYQNWEKWQLPWSPAADVSYGGFVQTVIAPRSSDARHKLSSLIAASYLEVKQRRSASSSTQGQAVSSLRTLINIMESPLFAAIRRYEKRCPRIGCREISYIIAKLVNGVLNIPIGVGSDRIELVTGFVLSERLSRVDYRMHRWLAVCRGGLRRERIDGTFCQFAPSFKGRILYGDYETTKQVEGRRFIEWDELKQGEKVRLGLSGRSDEVVNGILCEQRSQLIERYVDVGIEMAPLQLLIKKTPLVEQVKSGVDLWADCRDSGYNDSPYIEESDLIVAELIPEITRLTRSVGLGSSSSVSSPAQGSSLIHQTPSRTKRRHLPRKNGRRLREDLEESVPQAVSSLRAQGITSTMGKVSRYLGLPTD
ncbi:MAG: Fic family protein, partial [Candidatus Omnitrophica bacterium]|nr:Fic family protein [Candidatus Omnitrophota bacterium]